MNITSGEAAMDASLDYVAGVIADSAVAGGGEVFLIGGRMCSGKTTFAGALTRCLVWAGYDVYRSAFASPMKRSYADDTEVRGPLLQLLIEFGVLPAWAAHYSDEDRELLESVRRAREEMDKREFYQFFATDVIRKHNPEAFALQALRRIESVVSTQQSPVFVFDDWRFENELEALSLFDSPERKRVFTVWVGANDDVRHQRGCIPKDFDHESEKLDPKSVRIDYWLENDDGTWRMKGEGNGVFETGKTG